MSSAASDHSIQVRLVGEDAWMSWRDIRLRALQDSPNAFGSTYEREAVFTESDFRERLRRDEPAVLAFADDMPVGMGAGYSDLDGWLHLVAMWVHPGWRQRRIGRRVLEVLLGWAHERGLRVHLDVVVGNAEARQLYEGLGFQGTGQTEPLRPGSPHRLERLVLPAHPPD
ncbi:MAG: hypothetical protein AVDCRST_MAG72-1570 [uncultured Nocardioidaceae bacterium]|uniref:N-acetyltransferase domain-containing protein n=1 Tax=uncultured Nocardioidaceae bacterium TaxID=253824 RepID=A0A6J4MAN8_9ACTN|nr:MAG: hypothetical protein AVDCRST_MAG72-1570 [uncultured Nocardioidaceae bacterium]